MAEATQSELEAVAALVGTTNAELKHLDGQLTEESASLQSVNKNWNPNKILKDHITVAADSPSPGASPTSSLCTSSSTCSSTSSGAGCRATNYFTRNCKDW